MTDFAEFLTFCKATDTIGGSISIRYDGNKLTARQLNRICWQILDRIGADPEWDDCEAIVSATPDAAVDIAKEILNRYSPAERYDAGISVMYMGEDYDDPFMLIPEVAASEGRAVA